MYTRQDIFDMRDTGEITKEQASKMLRGLIKEAPAPEKKEDDSLKLLAKELRRLAESVEASIKNNNSDTTNLIPIMQEMYKAMSTKPKISILPATNPKEWKAEFQRDARGLIISPIRLIAVESKNVR